MDYEKIAKRFRLRFKFDMLRKYYGEKDRIVVLDVGAGNHSASIFKSYYPNSYYVGIDREIMCRVNAIFLLWMNSF